MKHLFILSTLLFLLSCGSKNETFITGKIENYDPSTAVKEVYMYQFTTPLSRVDTAYVQQNGVFKFETSALKSDLYLVGPAENNTVFIYIDSLKKEQEITIKDQSRWFKNLAIQGNEVTNSMHVFIDQAKEYSEAMNRINQRANTLGFNDTIERKKLQEEATIEKEEYQITRNSFIDSNFDSPALSIVLATAQINPLTEMDLINKVLNEGLSKSMPNSTFYKNAKKDANQIEADIKEKNRLKNLLKPGTPAPALNYPGVDGQPVSLASLRGKYVLIDFWASWCRPCRAENPNVVKLYNKYKDKGFDIYSFSLDKKRDAWVNAIRQDGLIWTNHASDLSGWQTKTTKLYNFSGIPFTVLIDPEGNVIDKKLRGPQLENKLKQIFGF